MKLPFMPVHIVTEKTLDQQREQCRAAQRHLLSKQISLLVEDNTRLRAVLNGMVKKLKLRAKDIQP